MSGGIFKLRRPKVLWIIIPARSSGYYELISSKGIVMNRAKGKNQADGIETLLGPKDAFIEQLRQKYDDKYLFIVAIAEGPKRKKILRLKHALLKVKNIVSNSVDKKAC